MRRSEAMHRRQSQASQYRQVIRSTVSSQPGCLSTETPGVPDVVDPRHRPEWQTVQAVLEAAGMSESPWQGPSAALPRDSECVDETGRHELRIHRVARGHVQIAQQYAGWVLERGRRQGLQLKDGARV